MQKKVLHEEKSLPAWRRLVAKINSLIRTVAEYLLSRRMALFKAKALHSCPFCHSCLHQQAMHTAVKVMVHPPQDVHNEKKVAAVYIQSALNQMLHGAFQ